MSVSAGPLSPGLARERGADQRALWTRIGLALAAVALVAGALALLAWLLMPDAPPPRPAGRTPFGVGVREAAPSASGLGGTILALQANFFRSLQGAVAALKADGGVWPLMGVGFAYGVFHAAGPGHGKAVIAAYLVSSERALVKGLGLSLTAALVQALVAIALVALVSLALKATAATMTQVANGVELASFGLVALLGALLVWRKAGKVVSVMALARDPLAAPAGSCDHVHLPPPEAIKGASRRELVGVVLAAGLRPCMGAVVVLVFALSQGLFAAGIAATVAIALGTALTTGAIASLAVFAKVLALRLAGGRGAGGALALAGVELAAAACVLVLGLTLLVGLWGAGGS